MLPEEASAPDDTRAAIETLDAELEDLRVKADRCGRTIALARAVAALGPVLLAIGWWRGDATVLVTGIAAALGGFVLAGSTASTREGLLARIDEGETRRADLIDGLHWAAASARITRSG